MTEVKEHIVDLNIKHIEFEEDLDLEEEKDTISFPNIEPFYVPWFWPVF